MCTLCTSQRFKAPEICWLSLFAIPFLLLPDYKSVTGGWRGGLRG